MTQLHVGRRYFITGAEPSQTQPEQIYDEDCGAGWREERGEERRDTQICLIDTIKRGKEVSVTQWRMMKLWASDHVFPLSSLVSRVKSGQWSHVATMANIETGGGGMVEYQAENVPAILLPAQNIN